MNKTNLLSPINKLKNYLQSFAIINIAAINNFVYISFHVGGSFIWRADL